jgi:hypothetical protein
LCFEADKWKHNRVEHKSVLLPLEYWSCQEWCPSGSSSTCSHTAFSWAMD